MTISFDVTDVTVGGEVQRNNYTFDGLGIMKV